MSRQAYSDHEEDKILGQLHALEAVRGVNLKQVNRFGTPELMADTLPAWFISGVRVSVRPTNLLIADKLGQKAPAVGAIKPYLASSDPLNGEAGTLYAALVHWYAEEALAQVGEADRRLTFVIDVFAKKIFQAPKAFKQRRDVLQYSCQEIYERWFSGATSAGGALEA